MPQTKRWSPEDEKFLINNYHKYSKEELSKFLNRSPRAIYTKLNRLKKHNIEEKQPTLTLSETEKSYIAGIIDGEGYIGFQIYWKNSKPHRATPIISIANKNKELMLWLSNKLSFTNQWKTTRLVSSQTDIRYGKNATYYHIGIQHRLRIKPFLLAIKPYSICKRTQIESVLKFLEHHKRWSAYTYYDWQLIYQCIKANETHRSSKAQNPEKLKTYLENNKSKFYPCTNPKSDQQ